MEMGHLIKVVRMQMGLSQYALATQLGFTNQFLGRVEKGGAPFPFKKLKKLSKTLKLYPKDIQAALLNDYANKINKYI